MTSVLVGAGTGSVAARPRRVGHALVPGAVLVTGSMVAAASGAYGARERWAAPGGPLSVLGASAAMTAAYLLLVLVVLVARVPALERRVGQVRLVAWHRSVGPWAVLLVVAHVALTSAGGAAARGGDLVGQVVVYATTYPWMLPAVAAALLVVSLASASWRRVLAVLRARYETWWVAHLYLYLALALAFGHQVVTGSLFEAAPALRWGWAGLHLAVLGVVVGCRVALPVARSLRHDLRVTAVVRRPDHVELHLGGRGLRDLPVRGGQFALWRVLRRGLWWQAHPYSLVPSADGRSLRLLVTGDGDFARAVAGLDPGTRLGFEGPYGVLTADRFAGRPLLVVAGGAGITAALGLLHDLRQGEDVVVLVRASHPGSSLLDEVREEGVRLGVPVHVLVGPRAQHPCDEDALRSLVPDVARRTALVWGPAGFVEALSTTLDGVGSAVHHEAFELGPRAAS